MRGIMVRGFVQTLVLGVALSVAVVLSGTGLGVSRDSHWGAWAQSQQVFDPAAAQVRHTELVRSAATGHGDCTPVNRYPRQVADGVVVSAGDLAWYLTLSQAFAAHAAGATVTVELFCYAGVRG